MPIDVIGFGYAKIQWIFSTRTIMHDRTTSGGKVVQNHKPGFNPFLGLTLQEDRLQKTEQYQPSQSGCNQMHRCSHHGFMRTGQTAPGMETMSRLII